MFKPDDIVQSKTGGPQMIVLSDEGETLLCARVDDAEKQATRIPADSVNLYHEDGDFGVC
ncbi:YodC family protein [Ewingella americana]